MEKTSPPRLAVWLRETKMRQNALAARLGISNSHICELIKGRKSASLALAFQIEDVTGGAVPARGWVGECSN